MRGGAFDDWAAGIDALAAFPHVNVKISGVTAYCAPGTASVATLKPWVDHALSAFGPDRVVWGGDWPVVNLGSGLPEWVSLSRELFARLSASEQAAVFAGNARALYRV